MTGTDATARMALEWVIAIGDPECGAATLAELDAWFAADPGNERIFWEVDAAWQAALLARKDEIAVRPRQQTPELRVGQQTRSGQRIEDRFLLHALEFESVLRACLYRYSRDASDVEELLQETYARLLVAGSTAQPSVRSMRAFCLTVARNVALDWLRHRQIVPIDLVADMETLDVLDEGAQIEEIVKAHQELSLLASAVEQLPARCRQVFTLHKVYGFSQKEIAERLQISENTVTQHLTKAEKQCAQALSRPLTRATSESAKAAKEDNRKFAEVLRHFRILEEIA